MNRLAGSSIVLLALGCSGGGGGESNPGAIPDAGELDGETSTDAASDVVPEASPGNLGDSCEESSECNGLAAALGSPYEATCSELDNCTFSCAGKVEAGGLTDAAKTCEELGGHCQAQGPNYLPFFRCAIGPDPGAPYPTNEGTYSQCLPADSTITCDEICSDFGKSCKGVHLGPSCMEFATDVYYVGAACELSLQALNELDKYGFSRCECNK